MPTQVEPFADSDTDNCLAVKPTDTGGSVTPTAQSCSALAMTTTTTEPPATTTAASLTATGTLAFTPLHEDMLSTHVSVSGSPTPKASSLMLPQQVVAASPVRQSQATPLSIPVSSMPQASFYGLAQQQQPFFNAARRFSSDATAHVQHAQQHLPAHQPPPGSNFGGMVTSSLPMAVPAANTGRLNSPGGNRVATVACKFYRHGKCTAGTACAFRHDSLEILHNGYYQPHMQQQQNGSYRAADVVLCKFYMKGTCKFGNRCSMAHGGGMWDTGTLRGAGDGNGFGDSTVYGVSPSSSSSVKDHYFSARWRRGSVGNNGTPYGSYGKPSQLSTSFGGDASAENVAHLISAPTAIYAGGMAGGGPTGTYPTTTSRSSASYDDDASVTANTTLSVSFRAQPLPSPDSIKHPAAPPPIRHKSMPDIFRWSADDGHAHPSGNFLFYSSSYADTHDDVDADEEDDDVLKQIPAVFEDVHDEGDADGDAANAENVRSNNGTSRARAIAITPPKQPNIRVKVVRPSVDMEPSRNDLRQSRESGGASTPDPFSPFPGDFSDQELEHEHNSFMESSEQRLRTMSLARGLLAAELQPLDGMAHVTPQRQALTDHHHAAASPYGMAVDNIPLSVEEELAHHLRDMHLRNVQLCPFAMAGKCRFGDKCRYVHGITCPTCQRDCLHPYQPETHAVHMVECQRNLERLTRSECVMCRLCGEEIFSRGKFGLLECEHAFCLVCIRTQRSNAFAAHLPLAKVIRCPECSVPSSVITPSTFWVTDTEEKRELLDEFKRKIATIPCKYFGTGECPFGETCHYAHLERRLPTRDRNEQLRIVSTEKDLKILSTVR